MQRVFPVIGVLGGYFCSIAVSAVPADRRFGTIDTSIERRCDPAGRYRKIVRVMISMAK